MYFYFGDVAIIKIIMIFKMATIAAILNLEIVLIPFHGYLTTVHNK